MFSKKSGLLLTLQVLEKETDSNHHLTQNQISKLVYEKSNGDLDLDRKTIAEYLRILSEDFEFDIENDYDVGDVKHSNKKGYALISRDFEESQVQILMDCLISSKFISSNRIKDYKESIFKHFSKYYEQDFYNYITKTNSISKNASSDIFLNAEIIIEAIRAKKDIMFHYQRFDNEGKIYKSEKEYHVVPFYLFNNFGNYYMLCGTYDMKGKGNKILFKVNYMTDIKIGDRAKIKKDDIKGFGKDFDIGKYLNENVYLYGTDGEPIDAEVLILQDVGDLNGHGLSARIAYVKEWFGTRAEVFRKGDKTYFKVRCSETGLKFWLLQFASSFELIKPASLRKEILEELKAVTKRYEK